MIMGNLGITACILFLNNKMARSDVYEQGRGKTKDKPDYLKEVAVIYAPWTPGMVL